jgi:hypothetical protein
MINPVKIEYRGGLYDVGIMESKVEEYEPWMP